MLSVLEEVYPDIDGKYNELIGAQRTIYTKRYCQFDYNDNYESLLLASTNC